MDRGSTSQRPIRVAFVYERYRTWKALKALLSTYPDIEVVAEVATSSNAVAVARHLHPDVIIMDAHEFFQNGTWAARHITKHWPEICVMVLTTSSEPELEMGIADTGICLISGQSPEELVERILESKFGNSITRCPRE